MLPQNLITLLVIASTVTAFPYPTLRPDLDTVVSACGPVVIPTPAPTTALPASGLPVSNLPVSGLPVPSLPVSGLPVTGLLVSTLTVSNLPISTTGVLPVPTLLHPNLPTSVLPSALPTLLGSSGSNGNDNGGSGQNGNQNVGNYGQNAGGAASNSGAIKGDYTVEQATTTCGDAQLNCCNRVVKSGDTTDAGVVGAVLGNGDLGIQCTPLDIAIIGVQVPINTVCAAKAACCQGDTVQNGLVNIGCIALASLL